MQARGSYSETDSVEEGLLKVGKEKLLPRQSEEKRKENSVQPEGIERAQGGRAILWEDSEEIDEPAD